MEAGTRNCASCGAAVSVEAPVCGHCGARVACVACTSCFQMMFLGSKFCPHCGAAAVRWEEAAAKLPCPGCEQALLRGELEDYVLHECARCFGLWVDKATLERICRSAERESLPAMLTATVPEVEVRGGALPKVRYVKCPECRQHMHRVNFAEYSGVVVDVCREHGTWFDAQELQRVVRFIRGGGMDVAREKKQRELASERRRLEAAKTAGMGGSAPEPVVIESPGLTVVLALLKGLMKS